MRHGPLKWEQGFKLLEIIKTNPEISAADLQIEGASVGIEIGLRTAFRFIKRYKDSGGDLLDYAKTHLQVVAAILQQVPQGDLLSPVDIREQALEQGISLHSSTVYRILSKLVGRGTVIHHTKGRTSLYEWKHTREAQCRIVCKTCGQQVEFEKPYLQALSQTLCSSFDFQHERMELIIHALCRQCRS